MFQPQLRRVVEELCAVCRERGRGREGEILTIKGRYAGLSWLEIYCCKFASSSQMKPKLPVCSDPAVG